MSHDNVMDWFSQQEPSVQLQVVQFGKGMLQMYQDMVRRRTMRAPADAVDHICSVINRKVKGCEICCKQAKFLQVRVSNTCVNIHVCTARDAVTTADLQTFKEQVRENNTPGDTLGSSANGVPVFVAVEDVSIPGVCGALGSSRVRGTGVYFLTGVYEHPDRLLTLLHLLTDVFAVTSASVNHALELHGRERPASVETMSAMQDIVKQQVMLENLAKGVLSSCRGSITALNTCIAGMRHTTTAAHPSDTMSIMVEKMCRAWDDLRDKQQPLTRPNTIETIARLFPGDQDGFKNPNAMANTLRYHGTSFTTEKTKYMHHKKKK